jgi:phospholipase A-2-activating protein
MLRIERITKISDADLKDVVLVGGSIITAGRDDKIRIQNMSMPGMEELMPNQGYVNCLAAAEHIVVGGCHNGCIVVYSTNVGNTEVGECVPEYSTQKSTEPVILRGHGDNVCTLDLSGDRLLSGSWDSTAKLWSLKEMKMLLSVEHPATVWSARFIDGDRFVTGCADKQVRIYSGHTLVSRISFHVACVRSVCIGDGFIVSTDNEGITIKTSIEGQMLNHRSLKEFIYSVELSGKQVVCSGENGRVAVLNEDLTPRAELEIPTVSCWRAVMEDGRLYVAGSDGRLYVYSEEGSDEAEKELEEIKKSRAAPLKDGEFVSGDQKFKSEGGKIYQEVGGEWVFIGEGAGVKPYDNSFQVELDNKYYELAFNNDENVYQVADNFLRRNKLRDEFRDDIVDFINRNFKQQSGYKIHEGINIGGVKKFLEEKSGTGSPEKASEYAAVIRSLERPMPCDSKRVEEELRCMLESEYRFVALDLYRYFLAHNYQLDLSFMLSFHPRSSKEELTFVRLISNLLADPPFNLDPFHSYVMNLRDRGCLSEDVLHDYLSNRAIRNKN